MEQTEILEGNKIIAEFDGKKYKPVKAGYSKSSHHSIDKKFRTQELCLSFCDKINKGKHPDECFFPLPDLWYPFEWKYHSSWESLMPVVEKIESSKVDNWPEPIKSFTFRIESKYCLISGHSGIAQPGAFYQTPYGYEPESKIHATWLAVVGFIKWYNSLKS